MLRVVKSESVSGGTVAVRRFVFEFDNGSYLPVNTYQLGLTTYIIADDSEGINIEDNSYYIYKNGKWNLSHNEIPTSYNDTTITNNGTHSVSNNDIVGYNDIDVNVESGGGGITSGLPKLVSPVEILDDVYEQLYDGSCMIYLYNPALTDYSKNFWSSGKRRRVVAMSTVKGITAQPGDYNRWSGSIQSWILFTPAENHVNFIYFSSAPGPSSPQLLPIKDADGKALSDYELDVNKSYKLEMTMTGSTSTLTSCVGKLTEYDTPVGFELT